MSELSLRAHLRPQIWHNNPVMVQLLGLSPLLAITTTVTHGIVFGLSTALVLLFSSVTVKLSKNLLSTHWRFVFYLFVLSVFTSIVELVLRQYFYAMYRELGVYVPLICCNLALPLHLDTQLDDDPWWKTLSPTVLTCAGILCSLLGFALLRELIIYGTVFTDWHLMVPMTSAAEIAPGMTAPVKIGFAKLAPAALMILALLLALRNVIQTTAPTTITADTITPVTRARVTGKIQLP